MGHQLLLEIDDKDYFPLKLGNEVLGGSGLNSLLFNEVREKLGLVYIDGAHDKKSVIENFNYLLKFCHNDSVFIINDMYGSKKMTEAWDILKNHKAVTVSIDSFFWGLLFFRKEQSKQHFTIRL